ncbi:MAG: YafY family transcriptional regulator [Chloroflexi bacterium]|nr:MAG: YafY family transcriptional regulator [Chloroflexota bacterium]
MYSPTTRLLSVLELLQSRRQMSGSEMARRLEVDRRTVRRYIVMLQDMGIPVEAERGPYGNYQLQRGHKIPPLMFTDTEAIALTLGLLAIREFRFPVEVAAVESALAKTERVLPEKLLQQARALQEAITLHIDLPPTRVQNDFVKILSLAVQQRRQVRLSYRSWEGEESEREFDPYGIVFNEGYWYTSGYCHLRHDLRTFRLDRITALEGMDRAFVRPDDFDVLEHVLNSLFSRPGTEQVEVLMKTTLEHARQVTSPDMGTLEKAEQGVIFRRAAQHLEWVAFFLMCLDFPVVVLQTPALRETLRRMGAKGLQMAGDQE